MQNWSKCYGQVTFKELLCLYLWLPILGNPAATQKDHSVSCNFKVGLLNLFHNDHVKTQAI